jgi:hypothetical protein
MRWGPREAAVMRVVTCSTRSHGDAFTVHVQASGRLVPWLDIHPLVGWHLNATTIGDSTTAGSPPVGSAEGPRLAPTPRP